MTFNRLLVMIRQFLTSAKKIPIEYALKRKNSSNDIVSKNNSDRSTQSKGDLRQLIEERRKRSVNTGKSPFKASQENKVENENTDVLVGLPQNAFGGNSSLESDLNSPNVDFTEGDLLVVDDSNNQMDCSSEAPEMLETNDDLSLQYDSLIDYSRSRDDVELVSHCGNSEAINESCAEIDERKDKDPTSGDVASGQDSDDVEETRGLCQDSLISELEDELSKIMEMETEAASDIAAICDEDVCKTNALEVEYEPFDGTEMPSKTNLDLIKGDSVRLEATSAVSESVYNPSAEGCCEHDICAPGIDDALALGSVQSRPVRRELRENFEDTREVRKSEIAEEFFSHLVHLQSGTPIALLRNKIIDAIIDAPLLFDIDINDSEYELLCQYAGNRYLYLVQNKEKPSVDILLTVALVQIGMRTYNSNYWANVAKELKIKQITSSRHTLLGESAMKTLQALGKTVSGESEYVTTILMHGFIADSYANRVFDYLFRYYNYDLKRDISDFRDADMEDLCASIINPYAKRQQLISNYMGMSVRAETEYCKKILKSLLVLIDQSFWNEYNEEVDLPSRLEAFFQKWKEESDFYKEEKKRNNQECGGHNRIRQFRTPQLRCEMEDAEFYLVLPEQLARDPDIEYGMPYYWRISDGCETQLLRCKMNEVFSGYSSEEQKIHIEPKKQFLPYHFEFIRGNTVVREFRWKQRTANFFDSYGNWMNAEQLKTGEAFAFSKEKAVISSSGLLGSRDRNGLTFYEFYFSEGDVIRITGEANYYVGQIPANGLSNEGRVESVTLVKNGSEYPLYSRMPGLIFSAEESELNGIAIILNGTVSRFSSSDYVDLLIENAEKYYFLDMSLLPGRRVGINKIEIDFPGSSRSIFAEYGFIPQLEFHFEDAPYVFQPKGTLSVNLNGSDGVYLTDEKGSTEKDFEVDVLDTSYISRQISVENDVFELHFEIPMVEYSMDGIIWSKDRPEDLWHNDLPPILYFKAPGNVLEIAVSANDGYKTFSYKKQSNGTFACDITKLKTYLYDGHVQQEIALVINNTEYCFVKILMKSHLVNVILEADIENEKLVAKFDILGKNEYFADIICNNKVIFGKTAIVENQIIADALPHSAEYTVSVYEQEDEFGFDENYSCVGSRVVSVMNPAEMAGRRFSIQSISMVENGRTFPLDADYYGFLEEQDDSHHYKGYLVEVFHGRSILQAFHVSVSVPSLSEIGRVKICFFDEFDDLMDFEYDHYLLKVVEEEKTNISKSEAYRRYEMLDRQDFVWNILYEEEIKDFSKEAKQWIRNKRKVNNKDRGAAITWNASNSNKNDRPITEMDFSLKTYNVLRSLGIRMTSELVARYKDKSLTGARRMDTQVYTEIVEKLKEKSLI